MCRTRYRTMLTGSIGTAAMRNGSVIPVIALLIERAITIVVGPVATDHEADHRNPDTRTVIFHDHALILIVVLHVATGHPTAGTQGDYIAPFPTIGATLDVHRRAGGNRGDARVADVRPGTQIQVRRGKTIFRMRERRQRQDEWSADQPCKMFHRGHLPSFEPGRTKRYPSRHEITRAVTFVPPGPFGAGHSRAQRAVRRNNVR